MRGISGVTTASLLALAASARAQGVVRGVNLGGWLVTEPWMTPSIFSETNTTCEWDLCAALGKDECTKQLQNHWSTFYTRDDLSAIKQAGLTSVRIPLGYWAVDLLDYEPYVSGQYPYLIQAVQWANELGLKVFLDLHGVPGSQNGWEESGIVGAIGFPDNSSNSDRSLNVLKNLTQEFTKDIYGGVVTSMSAARAHRASD
jgi:glucan 1,3-beta-glucosidase